MVKADLGTKQDPISKITTAKEGWRCDSSARAHVCQPQSPEFLKKKKKRKRNGGFKRMYL
jgi:hypothetical protein